MTTFFDFLSRIDSRILKKAVDKALEGYSYDTIIRARVMQACKSAVKPQASNDSVCLWAFKEQGTIQARVILMHEDDMMDYNPAIVKITAQPLREYFEDACFDSCEECLDFFLSVSLRKLRIDRCDRVAFAATVLRDIILGTSVPNPAEVTISEVEEARLNALRRDELSKFLEDFSNRLPIFDQGTCWHNANGASREVGIKIEVDSVCAICGENVENSGLTIYGFGKRLCFYCAETVYSTWSDYHRDHIDHCPHCQSKLAQLTEHDEGTT